MGNGAAMAAPIAARTRDIEGGGPGRIHAEEGKERGSENGRRVVGRRLRHTTIGRGQQPEGGGAGSHTREQGKGERELASGPHLSVREGGERESVLTGGSGWRAGLGSNEFKNNPNLI
jgi:hypothetical protein